MIEADMTHPPGIVTEDELRSGQQAESSEYMLQRRKSFISFDVFREEYWAHFPQSLIKGLGPFLLSPFVNRRDSDFVLQTSHLSLVNSWVCTASRPTLFPIRHIPLGVIKGSEMTLDSETHFLDSETYLNLSTRTQAMFASRRKEIYILFETYLKMKRDRREYDAADRLVVVSFRQTSQTLTMWLTEPMPFSVVWRRMV